MTGVTGHDEYKVEEWLVAVGAETCVRPGETRRYLGERGVGVVGQVGGAYCTEGREKRDL